MRYYLDCEFNGFRGELISLAMVREDGPSIYLINSQFIGMILDPWVKDNVIPLLHVEPTTGLFCPSGMGEQIATFLNGDRDPVIVADWPDDIRYFCAEAITGPGTMIDVPRLSFEVHRVDAYPPEGCALPGAVQHNAWWDAMALRHLAMRT